MINLTHFVAFPMGFPSYLLLPTFAQLLIFYPFCWAVYNALYCAPFGSLQPLTLQCTCPNTRTGRFCETCLVDSNRGKCLKRSRVCFDKWMGPLCNSCFAENTTVKGVVQCKGPCKNELGYYDSETTTKCIFCNSTFHCSGHGQCGSNGKCVCNEGYASPSYLNFAVQDCSAECKLDSKGRPCGGNGKCVRGGFCQCNEPFCGDTCQKLLATDPTEQYCNGMGLPILNGNNEDLCTCSCFKKGRKDAAYGDYCQHKCPPGTNGEICGLTGFPTFRNDQCECECGKDDFRKIACDQTCQNGGTMQYDGSCKCLYPRQDPEQNCARCTSNDYHFPSIGCTEFCNDETTCSGQGSCFANTQTMQISCLNCPANHDGTIQDVVAFSLPRVFENDKNDYEYIVSDRLSIGEGNYLKLTIDYTDQTTTTFSILFSLQNFNSYFDSKTRSLTVASDKTFPLDTPAVQDVTDKFSTLIYAVNTGKGVQGNLERNKQTCRLLGKENCAGYTTDYVFKCFDQSSGACSKFEPEEFLKGDMQIFSMTFDQEVVPNGKTASKITFEEVLHRGCSKCLSNWFPDPSQTGVCESGACVNFCDASTCNEPFGQCTSCGTCQCRRDSIDPSSGCEECKPNYFPAPNGTNTDTACTTLCLDNAMSEDDRAFEQFDISSVHSTRWWCSGHGECVDYQDTARCYKLNMGVTRDECVPIDFDETVDSPLGWSGEHCQMACNVNANESDICSGHGSCFEGRCSCDTNYAGYLCDVTCKDDDQYFYATGKLGEDNIITPPDDEDNENDWEKCNPDDTNSLCFKSKCNGAICKPINHYSIMIQGNERYIYFQPCTFNNLYPCIGETGEDGSEQAKVIRNENNVFCDTGNIFNKNGICAKMTCHCAADIAVTNITNTLGDNVEEAAAAVSLGGPGCQYAGCGPSSFPYTSRLKYSSMCGHIPPVPAELSNNVITAAVQNDQLSFANFKDEIDKIKGNLGTHTCPHGTCVALNERQKFNSTNPAPLYARASRGVCDCYNTPKTDCDFLNETWPQKCCQFTSDDAKPLYFGKSCSDRCVCTDTQFGTCHDMLSTLTLGCSCRQGMIVNNNNPNDEVKKLEYQGRFSSLSCGIKCTARCRGIVKYDSNEKTFTAFTGNFVDECEKPPAKKRSNNCFANLLPCSGHGWCQEQDGTCVTDTVAALRKQAVSDSSASCKCWGEGVPDTLSGLALNPGTHLPQDISLYAGENCQHACPGHSEVDKHLVSKFDTIHATDYGTDEKILAQKKEYFQLYERHVCSGHGHCDSTSKIYNDTMLQCNCRINYAGFDCNQRCNVSSAAWGNNQPGQLKQVATIEQEVLHVNSSAIPDFLADNFGLSICGPNAQCAEVSGNAVCAQSNSDGFYSIQTYQSAKINAANLARVDVSDNNFINFFNQWDMMFVGDFATCRLGYYSSKPRPLNGIEKGFISDLPPLVRWQIKRSCDAVYTQNTWNVDNGPWCCRYDSSGDAWKDENPANYIGYTHGGCPDNFCPNFAVGRACEECVSSAYVYHNPTNTKTCPSNTYGFGNCAKCAGQDEDFFVSPFSSLMDAHELAMSYMVGGQHACERCISYARTSSGEQLFRLSDQPVRVCNNVDNVQRGRCLGWAHTFSGNQESDALSAPSNELLCSSRSATQLQLGLCKCNEGWEGPTCAMPTLQSSCGGEGILTNITGTSQFKSPSGVPSTPYMYCKCQKNTGFYCSENEVIQRLAFAIPFLRPCQSIQFVVTGNVRGAQIVECNDPTGNSPCDASGYCSSCAEPELDPFSLCREYKAYGPDGIVEKHQAKVAERSGCYTLNTPTTLSPTQAPTQAPTATPTPAV